MSFLVTAALAIGLLVIVPIAAHLLRRGRATEQAFPPARLVPAAPHVARRRSKLEDRLLLSIRALMIAALAMLGATPFVRCSRLSLDRTSGASVALAIVLDDSLSMRAELEGGETRWEHAVDGARDLLDSAREGDAVALVLAGRPARLALAATTDLSAARRALSELQPSDRPTDLDAAVRLGRSSLEQLPHVDKRVVVLSDLAGAPLPEGEPAAWTPIPELSQPMQDCGVVMAERQGRRVTATLACSSSAAAQSRKLELVAGDQSQTDAGKAEGVVASKALAQRSGEQTLTLELEAPLPGLMARLTGKDAIAHDDRAPVVPEGGKLVLGVMADPTTSSVTTGGPTVLEQAVDALATEAQIRPLTVMPDDAKALEGFAAVFIDDPAGFAPEARSALLDWLERGGVALAFLGPESEAMPLGSNLEPFAGTTVRWTSTDVVGADPQSLSWLGQSAATLAELGPTGRVHLQGAELPGSKLIGKFSDGQPLLLERSVGSGLVLTLALPVSVSRSDLALRPGFLALLDHALEQAANRTGPRRSVAGTPWVFPGNQTLSVQGPDGELEARDLAGEDGRRVVTPTTIGHYRVKLADEVRMRLVTLDPEEITAKPRSPADTARAQAAGGSQNQVDASSELALLLLLLAFSELLFRAVQRFGWGRRRTA